MSNERTLTESEYRDHVHQRIETLMPILAQVAVGDYSHDVPLKAPHDEFSELYVGVQLTLEAIREKISQLEDINNELEDMVAARSNELFAAEQNQAEVEALLGSIGEGVVAMNKAGEIFFANHELARFAGVNPAKIKNRHYYSAITIEDENGRPLSREERPMHQALQSGKRVSSSIYFYRPSTGQPIPVAITATPIVLKNKIIGGIDVIRDISKEREADRLKSEFVSLASHQLRTPATAVKGFLSLLLDGYSGRLTATQTDNIRQAFAENEHELKLIDDMLDVAKLDAGEMTLEPAVIDIGQLIEAVVAEQQDLLRGRRQTVSIESASTVSVLADPSKLQMVFENLITNAGKYSPENSHITIRLKSAGPTVTVQIEDQGIGIAPQDLPALFKRFSRAANAAKTHTSGSGLGLYLAKKIIDLHRGKITVISRLGQGSTFTVTLPKQNKEP